VREILILHTAAIAAELLRRGPDLLWPREPSRVSEGALTLDSISLTVPLAALCRTTRLAPPAGS
jgi:hypothetical protein